MAISVADHNAANLVKQLSKRIKDAQVLLTAQSDKIYKITRFYAFKCAVSTISKTFFFKSSEFEDKDTCKLFF